MSGKSKEQKKLGLFDVFSLGFGGAVGSGIFVLMGSGIAATGKSIVLAVIVGVFFMLLAYWYNILMASMFVFEGGDYSQKSIVFNPLLTGVSAYIVLINGLALSMYGLAMVQYASIIFPIITPYTQVIAIGILTFFFAATIRGAKFVAILNNMMTIVLIGSILLFITLGFPKVNANFFSDNHFFLNGLPGFIAGISIMGWACQGTTMGPVAVAGVTKRSTRTVPTAILLVCVMLAIVYGLMAYVASGVLSIDQVAGKSLSAVAEQIFPYPIFVIFILGGAVFAIGTSMISGIQMLGIPLLKVAKDGWLPKYFTKTLSNGYPWVMYLLLYMISVIPVALNFSLDVIVSLVMIPTMLMNVYLNFACIKVIKKYPTQWQRSMLHMPSGLIQVICVIASICAMIVCYNLFLLFNFNQMVLMIGLIMGMLGLSYYCIATGKVSTQSLQQEREKIIMQALKDSEMEK